MKYKIRNKKTKEFLYDFKTHDTNRKIEKTYHNEKGIKFNSLEDVEKLLKRLGENYELFEMIKEVKTED